MSCVKSLETLAHALTYTGSFARKP